MNKIYRLIWSQALNTWVCCAENARGCGKSGSAKKCVVGAAVALLSPMALAAPTGGQISAGSGVINQAGLNTTINQSSQNLAINWQGFSIAANEAVRFNQPNASAIALNRVTGQNPSQILGSLSANGQVFVLNPNGVLFGAGSQVNVGGLVASTLSLSDADFMAGKSGFSGSSGSVVNRGNLTAAQGGYIALLAPEVRNEGVIVATLGTALLAAGNKVTLNLNNGSLLSYSIDQGAINALAENKQLIQADGGQVFMSAKAADTLSAAVVNNTGIVQARTIQNVNGTIKLMGDMQVGTVNVGGTLDASAPNGGNGGFIETSAAHVHVANDAKVTTLAGNGLNGTWLIDPVDFTIAATGGDMTGAAVTAALAGGNFSILSTSGATGTAGNVNVNDTVSWAANLLTLNAQNNININAAMNATGTASLSLLYGQGAVALNNTSNIVTGVNGVVNLPASTTNFTTLQGSNGVLKNYTVITALGAAGSVTATDLQGMSGGLGLNYVLGANINAAATGTWNVGAGFTPIGSSLTNFSGTFDGLGHTISNLILANPMGYNGMFGFTATGSTISNLELLNVNLTSSAGDALGGLVSVSRGTISNVGMVGGSVSGARRVGGLVGLNYGTISNSYATGSVSGSDYVGGLVGSNAGTISKISNSYATGSVSGAGLVGGLVGYTYGAISSSYFTGSVSGSSYAGGLAGVVGRLGTITNSFYDLDVVTINTLKPVAANGLYTSQFTDWKNSGFALNPVTYFGAATAANTYTVTGVQGLKDLLGFTGNAALTFNLAGNIDMAAAPAGFHLPTWAGTFDGANHTLSNFTLNNSSGNIGMFGKALAGSVIKNVGLLNVNVTGSTGNTVGGLVGSNYGTVSNSYVTGSVSGSNYVGGLVGGNYGTIGNSYATGSVSGSNYVGGLAGYSWGATISNSYATGSVTGTTNVGGLLGYNNGGTRTANFWDTTKSGKANGLGIGMNGVTAGVAGTAQAGVSGLITAQMQTQASFTPAGTAAGQWDFTPGTGTWVMFEGQSNPLLRSFLTPLTVTANNASKTYNGLAYNGSAGVTYSVTPNMSNLLGTLSYTGGTNAGSYAIATSGLYSNQQGYLITYANGALTVNKAAATVTANSATGTYSGIAQNVSGFTASGLVNGEAASVLTGVTATGSGTNAGSYNVVAAGTDSNYNLTLVNGALTINKAHLTVTADNKSRQSGAANPAFTTTVSGFANNETASVLSGAGSATTTAGASTSAGTAVITAAVGTLAANNYDFTNLVNGVLTITQAPAGGISPAVAQAIAALPGGKNLLPAYAAAIRVNPPVVVAFNAPPSTLPPAAAPHRRLVDAETGETYAPSTRSNNSAAATTEPGSDTADNQEATPVRMSGVQLQVDGSRIAKGSEVTIVNGGMKLPSDMRVLTRNEFNSDGSGE